MRIPSFVSRLCLALMLCMTFVVTAAVTENAHAVQYSCFPVCAVDDAKYLSSTVGSEANSLSNQPKGLMIITGADAIDYGVFDADHAQSSWDRRFLNGAPYGTTRYRLFANPTQQNHIGGLVLVDEFDSNHADALDNAWMNRNLPHAPEAFDATTGRYIYMLWVDEVDLTAESDNGFRVRADGIVTNAPGLTFAIQTALTAQTGLKIYPSYPSLVPTTYDGIWDFQLLVFSKPGETITRVSIWDGDLDTGDGILAVDTDDPDTPNVLTPGVIPPFPIQAGFGGAQPEGAVGVGTPPDNSTLAVVVRGESPTYTVTDPLGNVYTNTNTSGSQEWEKFEIRANSDAEGCDSSLADFCVDSIPTGIWKVQLVGFDLNNAGFFNYSFPVVGESTQQGVGNYVWMDENGDGRQDAGEPGIANVKVNVFDAAGNLVGEAITDASGGYFVNVPLPGTYTVEIDESTLPAGLTQTQLANENADFGNQQSPYSLSVGVGEANLTADFGYAYGDPDNNNGVGALGDLVWIDADGDGIKGSSEVGVGGVELTLYDTDGNIYIDAIDMNGDTGTGTTITNADGTYMFTNLDPGSYTVVITDNTPVASYTQTGDPDHFAQTDVSAGSNDGQTTSPVVIAPGDAYVNVDFGYQPDDGAAFNIGDTIYLDANANGVADAGEPGISGVTVSLVDATGAVIASTTSDENGVYLFVGVADGDYSVVVTDTDGVLLNLMQTGDPDGGNDNASSLTVLGADNLDQDFGYAPGEQTPGQGLIGDTVFFDADNNGQPDAGEGMGDVQVQLFDSTGNLLLGETVTDANGVYLFGGLDVTATYTVVVNTGTIQSGLVNTVDPDGGNDSRSVVDLSTAVGGINLDQDFGYVGAAPGSIGNLVWLDSNGDGVNDGPAGADGSPGTADDEPGLEGVTVDLFVDDNGNGLLDAGEPKMASAVTDSSGAFLFENLPAGDYLVKVADDDNVLSGYWHTLGDQDVTADDNSKVDPYAVTLGASENIVTADFGYSVALASLGDRVFFDGNANGIQDPDEPGIVNVEVSLTIDYPNGSQIVLTDITDSSGIYSFDNLLADEDYNGDASDGSAEPVFTVSVTGPVGLVASPIDQGIDDSVDSDDPNGELGEPIQGQKDSTNDFGYSSLGSISGNVSEDTDRDGTIEGPLSGVTVELFEDVDLDGLPDSGTPLQSTTTDVDGNYSFVDLPAGSYVVVETNPDGYESLFDGDVSDPGDDAPPVNDPTDDIIPVTIIVDLLAQQVEDDDGNNFVNSPLLASLGDTVWFDHNANGIQDVGENGIPDVVVNLISGGLVVDTAITDGTGFYEFAGIVAGTYSVEVDPVSLPTAVEQTHDFDDSVTTAPATPNVATVALNSGETNNAIDFGYRPLGTIGDTVWNDVNANGVQDGSEVGIDGVDVTLSGPVSASATTNAAGFYEFTDLPAGVYTVTVSGTPLDGLQQTHDLDDPVTTSPATADTASVELALSATEDSIVSRADVDFGYQQKGGITGTVFEDTDGDGTGDTALPGVTVELYEDTDGDGNPDGAAIATVTTNPDGSYSFTDISPGNYVVVEVPSTGMVSVSDYDTDPDGDPYDGNTTADNQIAVTVDPGETDAGNDFVDENQGSISGTVTQDTTGDGVGDSPQSGVTVELYADTDGDGNPDGSAIDSTTTATDGSYTFANVSPGNYVVVPEQSVGLIDLLDQDRSPDGDVQDADTTVDNSVGVTLEPGEADADNDFVDVNSGGSISGSVTQDTTGDGLGDTGIQGVVVEVFAADTDGNPIGAAQVTTTTDADGNYSFSGLLPGNYVVIETQPANLISVSDQDESPDGDALDGDTTVDNKVAVTLTAGESDTDNNFVDETAYGSVSGSILEDTNSDDVGDQPQPGVTVELFEDTNGNGVVDVGETVVDTTTTGADGSYQFDNVAPGNYVVVPVQNAGFIDVLDQDQIPDGDTQDDDLTVDNSVGVAVEPGEADSGNNFVKRQDIAGVGEICGAVEGVDFGSDSTIPGPVTNVALNMPATTVTGDSAHLNASYANDGNPLTYAKAYPMARFRYSPRDGLLADNPWWQVDLRGNYTLETLNIKFASIPAYNDVVIMLSDRLILEQTISSVSALDYVDMITIPGSQIVDNSLSIDVDGSYRFIRVLQNLKGVRWDYMRLAEVEAMGYATPEPAKPVTLELYADSDGDGIADAGSLPLETTLTDITDGSYCFEDVPSGSYVVHEIQPYGYSSVFDSDRTPEDGNDGNTPVDNMIPVTVTGDESDLDNVFVNEAAYGSVSGYVIADLDGNGRRTVSVTDGNSGDIIADHPMAIDRPLENVLIGLFRDVNGDGNPDTLVQETRTDADGYYIFEDVPVGAYILVEEQPAGLNSVADHDFLTDGDPLDGDTVVDDRIHVVINAGEIDVHNNFIEESDWRCETKNDWNFGGPGGTLAYWDNVNGLYISLYGNFWENLFGNDRIGSPYPKPTPFDVYVTAYDIPAYDDIAMWDVVEPGDYVTGPEFFGSYSLIYTNYAQATNAQNMGIASRKITGYVPVLKRAFGTDFSQRHIHTYIVTPVGESPDSPLARKCSLHVNTVRVATPLIIDLDADGVEGTGLTGSVFDVYGNGSAVDSGWTTDALLAYDSDGSGTIDSRNELFGGIKGGAFDDLAVFDTDQNGAIDAADAGYAKLTVWNDYNQNKITDAGELRSLSDAGVALISLDWSIEGHYDEHGNFHGETSSVILSNGQEVKMTDVSFMVEERVTQ